MRASTGGKVKNAPGFLSADKPSVEELRDRLSQSEERYRTILDQMQESYYEVDLVGNYTFVSESAGHSLGYSREELIGKNYHLTVHEDDAASVFAAFNDVYRTGKPNRGFAHRVRHRDGSIMFSDVSIDLKRGNTGEIDGFKCVSRDITERKEAQEKLRESEERFRDMASLLPQVIFEADDKGKFTFVNRQGLEMFGYRAEEAAGMNVLDTIVPEDQARAVENIADRIRGKITPPNEYTAIRKDGSTFPVTIYATPIAHGSGYAGMRGILIDITERKRAEEMLRESEAKYRLLAENARDIIWTTDMNLRFTYLSPSVLQVSGYTAEEVLALSLEEIFTPASLEMALKVLREELALEEARPGDPSRMRTLELEHNCKDGSTVWVEINTSFLRDTDGRPIGILGVSRDITERKQNEEKLAKSYKSLKKTLNDAIETMVKIVELRDPYTAGHQRKVADLATAIAEEMKLKDEEIEQLKMAAIIHDIGKIYVPSEILNKPGKLTEIELKLIRGHCQYGHDIVKGMNCPCSVSQAILQHHERLDGSGYPNHIKGEDTITAAKILAVADVVEAIASHRPYRPKLGIDKALEEISNNKGLLYDPDVVDACVRVFNVNKFEFSTPNTR